MRELALWRWSHGMIEAGRYSLTQSTRLDGRGDVLVEGGTANVAERGGSLPGASTVGDSTPAPFPKQAINARRSLHC